MGLEAMELGQIYTERFCVSEYGLGWLPWKFTHVIPNGISPHNLSAD